MLDTITRAPLQVPFAECRAQRQKKNDTAKLPRERHHKRIPAVVHPLGLGGGGGIVSLPPRSVTAGPISPRTIGKWISTDEAYIRRFQVPTPLEDIPMCFAAPATPPTESEPGGDVTGDSDPHPPYTRAETRLMKGSVRYWSFFAGRKMAYRVPRREGARHPSDTAGICRRSWGDLLQRLPVGSTVAFVQGRAEIQVPSSASRRSPSLRSYRAHRL